MAVTTHYKSFDVLRIDATGAQIPVVSTTLSMVNETLGGSAVSVAVDANGIVAAGTKSANVGDVLLFTHASYPGAKFRLTASATQTDAYRDTKHRASAFVVENLYTARAAEAVDIFAQDIDNPDTPPIYLGTGKSGDTLSIPYETNIEKNFRIYPVSKRSKGIRQVPINPDNYEELTVPSTGGEGGVTMGTNKLLGRVAVGTGAPQEITLGTGLSFAGTTLNTSGTGIANAAGSNVVTKSNGTNLVASQIMDDGTEVQIGEDTAIYVNGAAEQVLIDAVEGFFYNGRSVLTRTINTVSSGMSLGASPGTDYVYFVTAGVPVSLALASGNSGRYLIKNNHSAAITINRSSTDTIDGATSLVLDPGELAEFVSNQTNAWYRVTPETSTGDVVGPGSSTNNLFARFSGTTGKLLQQGTIQGADLTVNLKTRYLKDFGHDNTGLANAISTINAAGVPAKLVVTENLTVSASQTLSPTTVLEITNGAKITVTGGTTTLTIGKFVDPGNVQVFDGVSAFNHIVFSSHAVKEFNIAWYHAAGATDATFGFNDLITSCTNSGGGTIKMPTGVWNLNNAIIGDTYIHNITIEGTGFGTGVTAGTVLKAKDAGTDYVLRAQNSFRNITVKNCVIATSTFTSCAGISIYSPGGTSAFGFKGENLWFQSDAGSSACEPQLYITNASGAETVRNSLRNCQFITADNSYSFYSDTVNSQWHLDNCSFLIGRGSVGLYAYRLGFLEMNSCEFRGAVVDNNFNFNTSIATLNLTTSSGSPNVTAINGYTFNRKQIGQRVTGSGVDSYIKEITSATTAILTANASFSTSGFYTVYKAADITNRSGTAVLLGNVRRAVISGHVDEGFNYSLKTVGSDYNRTITFIGAEMTGRINIDGTAILYMYGGSTYNCAWGDTVGTAAKIYSDHQWRNLEDGSGLAATYEGIGINKSTPWGPDHNGGSEFFRHNGYRRGYSAEEHRGWHRVIESSGTEPTRPVWEIGTTHYNDNPVTPSQQTLARWYVGDTVSEEPKFWLDLYRDSLTGFWHLNPSQDSYYNGMTFKYGAGYGPTATANVTQLTSREADVTANGAHGIITTSSVGSIEAGSYASFVLNNNFIQNGDKLHPEVVSGATNAATTYAVSTTLGAGLCRITIFNRHASTNESGALKIKWSLERHSGGAGVTY